MNYEIGLYKHNARAYEKIKEEFNKSNKVCIVHATGTGKSFIALQLIYDFIKENPSRQVVYLTPLNGIKEQLKEHITVIEKQNQSRGIPFNKDYFDNVNFITYAHVGNNTLHDLDSMSRDELSHIKADMMILDEFHHIGRGADNWKAGVEIIEKSNPDIKIFGMSATSVRNRGTNKEEDVAETYFEGHIASEYPLETAIADGVLPVPNYHASYIYLKKNLEKLETRIKKIDLSQRPELSEQLKRLKEKISNLDDLDTKEIIKKYIKNDGKYIYFCPNGIDIEEIQKEMLEMLPEEIKESVEFYQVHSGNYSSKENIINSNNFYNNISSNGESSKGKLRIIFAVNMYNEGIHVPDIDGVIMARNTCSDIVFYQQLGRALANKKKNDNDCSRVKQPLVLDLQDNFSKIISLYQKVSKTKVSKESNNRNNNENNENAVNYSLNDFGISEELLDIATILTEIKRNISLSSTDRIKEIYKYYEKIGKLPSHVDTVKFSDDSAVMGTWLSENRTKIIGLSEINKYAKKIVQLKNWSYKKLSGEEKIKEIYEYYEKYGKLPRQVDKIKFSDNSATMGKWLQSNRTKIIELSKTNEYAYKISQIKDWIKGLYLSDEEKIEEMYQYYKKYGKLPRQVDIIKFSDNSAVMGTWLSENRTKIIELSEINKYAKKIVQLKNWSYKKLSDEEKIKEIYEYYEKTGKLPSKLDSTRFSNSLATMGNWLKSNKNKIIELSKTDEYAYKISQLKGWIKGLYLSDEEKIEEICQYYIKCGKLPNSRDITKFRDQSAIMGMWIFQNKNKIIELSEINEHARIIVQLKKWTQKKLSDEEKIEEIYEYYEKMGKLLSYYDTIKFSDDSAVMGRWLSTNRNKIIELSKTNEYAYKIAQIKGWIKGLYLSDEQKLKEICEYHEKHEKFPRGKDGNVRFSDDSAIMGSWIITNKAKILELSETNNNAYKISQLRGWIKMKKTKSFVPNEQEFNNISEKLKSSKVKESNKGENHEIHI